MPPGVRSEQLTSDYGLDDFVLGSVTLKRIEDKVFEHLNLGWVAVKSEEEDSEQSLDLPPQGQEDWTNPFTSSTVVTARKDDEEEDPDPPSSGRSLLGRLWRR